MKTFSLSMQTSDEPQAGLQEIIDALERVQEDLTAHIAAGGITLGSDTVVDNAGIGIGRWSFDRQTRDQAAVASFWATHERGKERPEGFTEAEWEAAKRLRPGLTKEKWEEAAVLAKFPRLRFFRRPKKGTSE